MFPKSIVVGMPLEFCIFLWNYDSPVRDFSSFKLLVEPWFSLDGSEIPILEPNHFKVAKRIQNNSSYRSTYMLL